MAIEPTLAPQPVEAGAQPSQSSLHSRAARGIKLLLIRQIFLQIFTFAGGVILARVLGPAQFGLFTIGWYLMAIFTLVADFGLAPSFIQRRADLTERDLQIGFTIQQILTTIAVVAIYFAAPWLAKLYPKVDSETLLWLVRSLAVYLYLTSWRSMSALQLERQLRYSRLAWIEVVETLSYQGTAVVMVLAGFGVWSLVCAVLVRGVLGTILVYLAAPWKVRFGFDLAVAKQILRYGIPFQAQLLSNHSWDWLTPVLVASTIGPQAVGFLVFASSNGKKPGILVDNVMRVAFPHFSRIQHDRNEVERVMVRYLTYLLLGAGLWLAVLLPASESLVKWLYTDKWAPAVPALVIYCFALYGEAIASTVGITLNSIGSVGFVTRIILLRSLIIVLASLALLFRIGYMGIPIAYLIAFVVTTPLMWRGLGPGTLSRGLRALTWLLAPLLLATTLGEVISRYPLSVEPQAIATTLSVCLVYAGTVWFVGPQWLIDEIRKRLGRFAPPTVHLLSNLGGPS